MDSAQYSEMVRAKIAKFHNPGLARLLKVTGLGNVEVSAAGCVITDNRGKEYLDFAGGYGVFNVGHSHPVVVEAVKKQMDRMSLASKLLLNEPLADLAEMLAGVLPGDMQYSFFCNSGAEAVEGAIKLSRMATGRTEVIATDNAFHGKTMGALSATGREQFKAPFRPLVDDFKHVAFGDTDPLAAAISQETAAVIIEPIQGEGGIIIPPVEYLSSVRELCDEHGAVMIADEIQTGLGRTGRMFAVDHEEVTPDIITLAKGLSGGVMPIGAFCGRPWVWEAFAKDPLIITSTFGGNPLACSAAMAALRVTIDEGLSAKAEEMGALLLEGLGVIRGEYPRIIQTVRGQGLMIGVELTKEGLGGVVIPEMIKAGVLAAYTLNQPKVIRVEPPLIVTSDQVEVFLKALRAAVTYADDKYELLFAERQ